MSANELFELAEALRSAQDPFAPFSRFLSTQEVGGFFYGFAGLMTDFEQMNYTEAVYHHHTYPHEWQEQIGLQAMIDHDPSIASMHQGASTVPWEPPNYREILPKLTPEQRRQAELEADLGMVQGISLKLDSHAMGLSGIGLWMPEQRTPRGFMQQWAAQGERLTAASNLLDAAVRGARPNQLVRLTPREIDCLCWLARGQRPAEICWRLCISERTFEKHIASAKAKLKSRTRDQALAKAVLLNLLPL